MKWVLLVLLAALPACGDGGSQSQTTTTSGTTNVTVTLRVMSGRGGDFSRNGDSLGTACGPLRSQQPPFAFAESGTVTVTNRQGTKIATGPLTVGSLRAVSTEPGTGYLVSQTCDFRVMLQVFEQPNGLASFSLVFTDSRATLNGDVSVDRLSHDAIFDLTS